MEELQNFFERLESDFPKQPGNKIGKEQSVIIYFNYGMEDDTPFYELSDKLYHIIKKEKLGTYDGHEIEMNHVDGSYYIYGPSAENIYKAIKDTLEATPFMKGATAVLTFGPSGTDCPVLELIVGEK